MVQKQPRIVSIEALCRVSEAICRYIDLGGCCVALNVSLALDIGYSDATVRAAVRELIALRAFDPIYTRSYRGCARRLYYPLDATPVEGVWGYYDLLVEGASLRDAQRAMMRIIRNDSNATKWWAKSTSIHTEYVDDPMDDDAIDS